MAQDATQARLREMLRRTTADLRAAQDSQAVLQATLDQEKQKGADLQKQVDELTERLAHAPKATMSEEEIAGLRADLRAAQARVAALEPGLRQALDANQQSAAAARAKDAEARIAAARATGAEREAATCAAANSKLIVVAHDILHLYESQGFRSLLFASYEPVLGLKKVELQNTIQDYEDKILDNKYRPARDTARTGPAK